MEEICERTHRDSRDFLSGHTKRGAEGIRWADAMLHNRKHREKAGPAERLPDREKV